MDLVAGVRKEGSRGGRGDFQWSDVRDSQHRENYLGHSLMAPVGRWQKNKDLGWYAKGDKDSPAALSAAEQRREEIRKIKEAENDALSKALGYEPVDRSGGNPNETPVGKKEVERLVKEMGQGDEEGGSKGVGFGGFGGDMVTTEEGRDVLGGTGLEDDERRVSRRGAGDYRRKEKRRSRNRETDPDIGQDHERGIRTGMSGHEATSEGETVIYIKGSRKIEACLPPSDGGRGHGAMIDMTLTKSNRAGYESAVTLRILVEGEVAQESERIGIGD